MHLFTPPDLQKMSLQPPNNQGPVMALWSADGQDIFAYPQNNPLWPTASTAGLTAEVSVGYHHGLPTSDHGGEAQDFDYALPVTAITALPVCFQLSPQYNFPPYQVSPVRLSVIWCILMCPRLSLWGLENIQLSKIPETTVTVVCAPRRNLPARFAREGLNGSRSSSGIERTYTSLRANAHSALSGGPAPVKLSVTSYPGTATNLRPNCWANSRHCVARR